MNSNRFFMLFLVFLTFPLLLHAEATLYKVETSLSSKNVKKGAVSKLLVTLTPLEATKINEEAPLSLDIRVSSEISSAKSRLLRTDAQKAEKHEARWEVLITAIKPGNAVLNGLLSFYLCTDKWCRKFEHSFNEKLVVVP